MKLSTPFQNSSPVQSRFQNVAFPCLFVVLETDKDNTRVGVKGHVTKFVTKQIEGASTRKVCFGIICVFWNHLCVFTPLRP